MFFSWINFSGFGCWFGLTHLFSTSFLIIVLDLCIYFHNFYCKFPRYLPLTTWSQVHM
jgi:hypothetical protein